MLYVQPIERRMSRFFGKIRPVRWRFLQKPVGLDLDKRKAKWLFLHFLFISFEKIFPCILIIKQLTLKSKLNCIFEFRGGWSGCWCGSKIKPNRVKQP